MPDQSPSWTLRDFLEQLDIWVDLEKPEEDLRMQVTLWIMSCLDDPYRNARREPAFPNLWYTTIPRSYRNGTVVLCSFEIVETVHEVRCKGFGTLNWPT